MALTIPFTFGLSPAEPEIKPGCALWAAALPLSRRVFSPSAEKDNADNQVTYGDYFSAARHFLELNQMAALRRAISRLSHRPVGDGDVTGVAIYLVKHGAFYHPSHLSVEALGRRWSLVLNVAISAAGRKILIGEYENLHRLEQELVTPFWPLVFGHGYGRSDTGSRFPMFLGQWLEGFYEFHLSAPTAQGHEQVALWDVDRGRRILTERQVREVLRQAAFILAYAYNPLTFEAILNWHHAAGDFVAQTHEKGISVRLITVRKYAPLIQAGQPDPAAILEAVLIHLMDVSLKLRTDRLDGTNQMACYPADTVPAICAGYMQGLHETSVLRGLPDDFTAMVGRFLSLHGPIELKPIAGAVLQKYSPTADEVPLLKATLADHISELAKAFSDMGSGIRSD